MTGENLILSVGRVLRLWFGGLLVFLLLVFTRIVEKNNKRTYIELIRITSFTLQWLTSPLSYLALLSPTKKERERETQFNREEANDLSSTFVPFFLIILYACGSFHSNNTLAPFVAECTLSHSCKTSLFNTSR